MLHHFASRSRVFGLVLLVVCAPVVGQDVDPVVHTFDSLLVLERPGRGGRGPVFTDAIELQRARGQWKAPIEGGQIELPDGTRREWRRVLPSEDQVFQDPALRGGYAFGVVESEADRVVLLNASGHRHVYVNQAPRVGDVYDLGVTRIPVHLRAGRNEFLFKAGRGRLRAKLESPPAPVFFEERDRTLPDVIRGEDGVIYAGVILTNATLEWQRGLRVTSGIGPRDGGGWTTTALSPLPPVSSRKVVVPLRVSPASTIPLPDEPESVDVLVALERGTDDPPVDFLGLTLRLRGAEQKHRRTFVSRIDGSVQYYGVTPARLPEDGGAASAGLVLTLHGAGVEGGRQAECYRRKDWTHVVAPTNRRPFGFDWEDWGRIDALEVLSIAKQKLGPDPARIYLTGHSMGGHGTWNLGAHFPDRFAAIAPSAGWRDFWAYGGATRWDDPDAVQSLLMRSANGSRTLLLEKNFLHGGVYILHGDADRTVRVDQARFMRKRLAEFHPNWAYYERLGVGHWWGNQCMDWPPLFDFLKQNKRPSAHEVLDLEFTTVHPGISARCYWVTVESQLRAFEPSTVVARIEPGERKLVVSTKNIDRLSFDLRPFTTPRSSANKDGKAEDLTVLPAGEAVTIELDAGTELSSTIQLEASSDGLVRLRFDPKDGWGFAPDSTGFEKGPARSGPFKAAFDRRVMFVYGTRGTEAENLASFRKARYDAGTFWYRGNGAIDIVSDVEFDPVLDPDRNVILYGHADCNGAWDKVLEACPIDVRRGAVTVGKRAVLGDDLACLFVYPRRGSDLASVGVVAGTGEAGTGVAEQLPYFVSGVGYPDWTVVGAEMLEGGSDGVRALGFFGPRWQLGDDQAWRKSP